MMLADSCEAAARSLARPDPENIRAIVIKIVDAIISDGQLDQCDVTLQELTTIREAMISALTAIYHARIDYPGFNPPAITGPLPPLPAGNLDSQRLAVLADALEDAGCGDAEMLAHLRGEGPHVRGCWVVDLLLARG